MIRADLERLKYLIETIEMIPNDKLGIILSQNDMGYYVLHLYSDSRDSLGVDNLIILIRLFHSFSEQNDHSENPYDNGGNASTKRTLLDYLNSKYLVYNGSCELSSLHRDMLAIQANKTKSFTDRERYLNDDLGRVEDRYLYNELRSSLFRAMDIGGYKKLVNIGSKEMAQKELTAGVLLKQMAKEYDFLLFSSFRENFRSPDPLD